VKTEVKKIDAAKLEVNIGIEGDIVKNKFEDIFKRIAKDAKIPGFRIGNAPRDILEKHYSSYAHEQVLKELIPDIYNEAVKKENLDVVGLPDISDVKLDRKSLLFKATVEINPEIKLKNYKGIKVNYKKITVTSDEVKRQLDSLKESRKIDNLDDNLAKGLGYPNVAELERAIEHQILIQKDNLQIKTIEEGIIESVLGDLDFKLPQSLIGSQVQTLVRQAKLDLALKGVPQDKVEEQTEALLKELEPQARRQVKVYLVLTAIAKKENIPLDDHMPHRVVEFLLKEADWKEES